MEERWVDVKYYEGLYMVSNYGEVKAINSSHAYLMSTSKTRNGKGDYSRVSLTKNKKRKFYNVHRLVMLSFNYIFNHKEMQVNHKDGDKTNNRLDNLEWCTSKHNISHAHKTGLCDSKIGINHYKNKLSELQVLTIREWKKLYPKTSYIKLSKYFGITPENTRAIVKKETWKHLL